MSLFLLLRPLGSTSPYATVTAGPFTESQIVAGSQTIVIDLGNETWVAAGAAFNAQRQAIINGLVSAQSEAAGWNNVVVALQGVAGVVRTSNTEVTITLDTFAGYDITALETITVTVPGSALTGGNPLVAGTFNVTATATVVDVTTPSAGVKRKPVRVRRSDFSDQKTYELALRAAMFGAMAVVSDSEEELAPPPKPKKRPTIVVKDTEIKVSPELLAKLQSAAEMSEIELIKTFIDAIDSEWT